LDRVGRTVICCLLSLIPIFVIILIVPFSADLGFAHAITDPSTTICNGTGLYVWNYNIGGRAYQSTGTANMIFTFISSNVQGYVSCQGGGSTQTFPLNNSPVNTLGSQNIQINLNQGAFVNSPFLGIGDLKIELTGINSTSSNPVSPQQQSIVQPTPPISMSIPEFGSLAGMIIAIAIISVMAISRKFRFKLK